MQRLSRPFRNNANMKTPPRRLSIVSTAVFLVGMVAAWIIFAPIQFGGQVAYVIVSGNSMEPLYRQGDLVIVHQAAEYKAGDIVTYRHPDIGPVIHRIVDQQGDRFVLKGDNNTWTDSYLPAKMDIIGKAWLYLAGLGKLIGVLRKPWILSIIVACAGGVFLFTFFLNPGEKKLRRGRPARKGQQPTMKITFGKLDDWMFPLIVLALVALSLTVVAFTHPLTRNVPIDIPFEQNGEFSYSAAVPFNTNIYNSPRLQTGDPMFSRLINKVDFQFDYQIISDSPINNVQGTMRLLAQLTSVDGWQKTFELNPATPFTGPFANVSGVVNLKYIQAILDNLETQTGIERQVYTLFLQPQVTLNGTIGNQDVTEIFTPQLEFQIDQFEMFLVRPGPLEPDPLLPSTDGLLKGSHTKPNTFSLLSMKFPVLAMRWISIVVLVLALGGLIPIGMFTFNSIKKNGESARIQRKYGSMLISVRDRPNSSPRRVINVQTIDDLARLADKEGLSILHISQNLQHIYIVQNIDIAYRYVIVESDKEKIL